MISTSTIEVFYRDGTGWILVGVRISMSRR
jgi:hypothetical protein